MCCKLVCSLPTVWSYAILQHTDNTLARCWLLNCDFADASTAEGRQLLALAHEWDITHEGSYSLQDLYILLQLPNIVKAPAGGSAAAAAAAASFRPGTGGGGASGGLRRNQGASAGLLTRGAGGRSFSHGGMQGASSSNGAVTGAAGTGSLQEAYLRERVAALEAELDQRRASVGARGVDAQAVAALRADVARYQARVGELEADFLSLDVMASTDLSDYDAEMRKAWYTAAAFKKR